VGCTEVSDLAIRRRQLNTMSTKYGITVATLCQLACILTGFFDSTFGGVRIRRDLTIQTLPRGGNGLNPRLPGAVSAACI
jgi:hypothetical protein